jgi:ketosteroid isomerase-like protein
MEPDRLPSALAGRSRASAEGARASGEDAGEDAQASGEDTPPVSASRASAASTASAVSAASPVSVASAASAAPAATNGKRRRSAGQQRAELRKAAGASAASGALRSRATSRGAAVVRGGVGADESSAQSRASLQSRASVQGRASALRRADMQSTESKEGVVARLFEAFSRRDLATTLTLVHPEIVFQPMTAEVTRGGEPYRGHDGITRYLEDVEAHWEELVVHLAQIRAAGRAVVALGLVSGRGPAGSFENAPTTWVVKFKDGLVFHAQIFSDARYVVDALVGED